MKYKSIIFTAFACLIGASFASINIAEPVLIDATTATLPDETNNVIKAGIERNLVEQPSDGLPSLCLPCLQLSTQGLSILVNQVVNVGVMGSCSKLCSNIETSSSAAICNIACDVIGIKAFINVVKNSDLDVFYFCESLHVCHVGNDDASGDVLAIKSAPESGAVGTIFDVMMQFEITKATGVGEVKVALNGGDIDYEQSFPNNGFKPGTYSLKLQVDTSTSSDWTPAVYDISLTVCQGECGSQHPHSIVLDQAHNSFEIIDKNLIIE